MKLFEGPDWVEIDGEWIDRNIPADYEYALGKRCKNKQEANAIIKKLKTSTAVKNVYAGMRSNKNSSKDTEQLDLFKKPKKQLTDTEKKAERDRIDKEFDQEYDSLPDGYLKWAMGKSGPYYGEYAMCETSYARQILENIWEMSPETLGVKAHRGQMKRIVDPKDGKDSSWEVIDRIRKRVGKRGQETLRKFNQSWEREREAMFQRQEDLDLLRQELEDAKKKGIV